MSRESRMDTVCNPGDRSHHSVCPPVAGPHLAGSTATACKSKFFFKSIVWSALVTSPGLRMRTAHSRRDRPRPRMPSASSWSTPCVASINQTFGTDASTSPLVLQAASHVGSNRPALYWPNLSPSLKASRFFSSPASLRSGAMRFSTHLRREEAGGTNSPARRVWSRGAGCCEASWHRAHGGGLLGTSCWYSSTSRADSHPCMGTSWTTRPSASHSNAMSCNDLPLEGRTTLICP